MSTNKLEKVMERLDRILAKDDGSGEDVGISKSEASALEGDAEYLTELGEMLMDAGDEMQSCVGLELTEDDISSLRDIDNDLERYLFGEEDDDDDE
jgi:hypothetical protein